MSIPNKYFDVARVPQEHPRIRAWKSYRKNPNVHHVGVDVIRERDGLLMLPARLFVNFYRQDGEIEKQDETSWEAELEDWLIEEEHAKATTLEMEKLRFSLLLKPLLRPTLIRYGDGYFNAVLTNELRTGPYRDHSEVAQVLRHVQRPMPSSDPTLADCQDAIANAIKAVAQRVLVLYKDDRQKAEDILGGAIAQYIDDRFSITNGRLLGLV